MNILQCRALRGPNYYHQKPVIYMEVDLGALEEKPSDQVPRLRERIEKMMPGLYDHTCSIGEKGGFFKRIEKGTWAGHVAEHIALELQHLIGDTVNYGKTLTLSERGHYAIVFRYIKESVGLKAGEMAVDITTKLFAGEAVDATPYLRTLTAVAEKNEFGPSTQAIVNEAQARGIPYIRLNEGSYVQLGHGKFQRRIEATVTDQSAYLGVSIVGHKERTKEVLSRAGIPVPPGQAVTSLTEALEVAERIGYPVVVKPLSANHGRGISCNVANENQLVGAFHDAQDVSTRVIVERHLEGEDYRLLVINNRFVAAARREPAFVVGDGVHTIRQLIELENAHPDRGDGHEKRLSKIVIDGETERVLALRDMTLDTIPAAGKQVPVKYTANISTGGMAIDVTDTIHPANCVMAERISRLVGLDIIGIDVVASAMEKPLEKGWGGVVEVNAGPGLRMHLYPSEGRAINVAKPIVDMLFPPGASVDVPICAVTGTNGKTTTCRLIAHILSMRGNKVGIASTDAVVINNVPILKGDFSGPAGASAVMQDPDIDHAVLEVARGGILRRGLGFQCCDVGVLLNVSSDHLGLGGIETVADLARLKSTVVESVKAEGYAVLNADDPLVLERASRVSGKLALFSKNPGHPALQENIKAGHFNVSVAAGHIIVQTPQTQFDVADIALIPITFGGRAGFNIENVMAATAAAYGIGVDPDHIRNGLMTFTSSVGAAPGRMNVVDVGDIKVVIDYGHNVAAAKATGDFLYHLMPGRKIRMVAGVGDRRKEDTLRFGETLADYADYVIITDPSPRGKALGETADVVRQGFINSGFEAENIEIQVNEKAAVQRALALAKSGDLVILQVENIDEVIQDVLAFREAYFNDQAVARHETTE